jgi:hypothetical protein
MEEEEEKGQQGEEVTGGWKKLHSDRLPQLCRLRLLKQETQKMH